MGKQGLITQSDKIVRCPNCRNIKKATGNHYFLCCGHRWTISNHQLKNSSEDDKNEFKESNNRKNQKNGPFRGHKNNKEPTQRKNLDPAPDRDGFQDRTDGTESREPENREESTQRPDRHQNQKRQYNNQKDTKIRFV